MIVDDAVVVRGLFARWVEAEPDLEVVASLRTGREAVNQLERVDPDVVVLDVDMPDLDGIAALPLLLEKKRDLVVIMASTLTRRNAEISLQGAVARRRRLHSEARTATARSRLDRFPPRPDREDPRSSACARSACGVGGPRRAAPRWRRSAVHRRVPPKMSPAPPTGRHCGRCRRRRRACC